MKRVTANLKCCWICPTVLLSLFVFVGPPAIAFPQEQITKEELLVLPGEVGRPGGRLVVSLRGEPKTLNPLIAADARSREVIGVMQADLVHINRARQQTEPALAKSWKISPDGLSYTIVLRQGLKFSDGQPLDADDVLFTFRVYLDENVHAPQRDLLIVAENRSPCARRTRIPSSFNWRRLTASAKGCSMAWQSFPGISSKNPTKRGSWGRVDHWPRLRINGRGSARSG